MKRKNGNIDTAHFNSAKKSNMEKTGEYRFMSKFSKDPKTSEIYDYVKKECKKRNLLPCCGCVKERFYVSKSFINKRYNFLNKPLLRYGRKILVLKHKSFIEQFSKVSDLVYKHRLILDKIDKDRKYKLSFEEASFIFENKYNVDQMKQKLRDAFHKIDSDSSEMDNDTNYNRRGFCQLV